MNSSSESMVVGGGVLRVADAVFFSLWEGRSCFLGRSSSINSSVAFLLRDWGGVVEGGELGAGSRVTRPDTSFNEC